jgi:tetratricopeptide (TPR) repeat protein
VKAHVAAMLVALIAITGTARAETSEAEQLFQEGLKLYEAGKYDEACAKFELSIAKDPRAVGTLMNLGRCNERRGKIATALKLFQEAYDRATDANLAGARDKAQERIAALAPQVPMVKLVRKGRALDGEKVVIDDVVVPPATTELPLDPGKHVLVQTAPGRLPSQITIAVVVSERSTIQLVELQAPKASSGGGSRRSIGVTATLAGGGLSLGALGVAVYAWRDYKAQFDDPDGAGPMRAPCGSFPDIGGQPSCDKGGQERTERARNLGTIATVVGAVGVVAAATGVVLWVTSPKKRERAVAVVPAGAGLFVVGRF